MAIAQNPLLPAVILLQSNEETDVDGWSPFYSSSVGPVSYTHLDVYKRQCKMSCVSHGSRYLYIEGNGERRKGKPTTYNILQCHEAMTKAYLCLPEFAQLIEFVMRL